MATYHFREITVDVRDSLKNIDPRYVHTKDYFSAGPVARDFMAGKPVPKGMEITFEGRRYLPGEIIKYAAPAANAPQSPAKAPASVPTLDMFDNTDPNAPRTADQNNAFWGLMEKLGKLTGKTGEEMKTVVVTRALGENKGTSKLTVAEMEKVIRFVKDTIALFEQHDWAVAGKEQEA